jgi:uncharacterized 2Fe-2S/4Fe-4S cluster protein (DUF4445 family)
MEPNEKAEYEKRLARISEIFRGIALHADEQALTRCPYKNRLDQCTAKFGCGYQGKPAAKGDLLVCRSDDQLDYRTAWEENPEGLAAMSKTLRAAKQRPAEPSTASGHVSYEGTSCGAMAGKTIFDHADALEVRVPTSCGRMGSCHECIVEIRSGAAALSAPTAAEGFLGRNYRLACQAVVEEPDAAVDFALLRRTPKILVDQERRAVVTRRGDRVYYEDQDIDKYRGHIYGISVDVGTTTVVLELLDLETGESLAQTSFENPQRFGGSDVMNRISYDAGKFQGELHKSIINTFNTELRGICATLSLSRHEIYEIVVAGNSTMRELFFGLDVQSIGQRPYKSIIETEYLEKKRDSTSLNVSARELRILANKNARVFGIPLIASHVGGDVTADLVAVDMASQDEVVMLVDVGTNTEVIIGHRGRLLSASCPAGPAFEGGLVQYGMPGCEGAIEHVSYVDGEFQYQTIGDGEPQGICGSGFIDLLAELRRNGLVTPKGVFANKAKELTIAPEQRITFSRRDASELAQAKAANFCGQMILMREYGVRASEISKLYLAGGFANYVDPAAAIEIGFLAPVPVDRVVKVGNAAAQGARELLISRRKRETIEKLIKTIQHVELETTPDFFDVFVEGCQIKPMEF